MKKPNFFLATLTLALALHCVSVMAQPQQQQRMDWQNMDPQQIQQMIQQRMMENFREQLAVTNDAEWSVIEERLAKVSKLRMESTINSGAGMMGGMRRGGGGGQGGGMRGFGNLFQQDADTKNLQDAVDNNSPTTQVKAAMTKLREARKQKQAELAKAQEELRKVLTTRQEATMILAGMLD
jgi:hypothetical protein